MANDPVAPDNWTIYLHTADIAATVDKPAGAGAVTCVQPMRVPGASFNLSSLPGV